ncbi:MAG: rhomboid family intramembrane serine protease, partial [Planctomycetota bacterium]
MRRVERFTLGLVLLCVLWTLPTLLGWRTHFEAGALSKRALWQGETWRLVTSTFLHGDTLHLALNGISLYLVGAAIVRGLGWRAAAAFLAASAAGGHAAGLFVTDPENLSVLRVGISGAIFGLVGLVLAVEWASARGWRVFLRRRNVRLVGVLLVVNVAFGLFVPEIDQAAHAGGFLTGLIVGLAAYGRRGPRPLAGAAAALLVAGVPLAYACHPLWDVEFHLFRGDAAYRAEDAEA